eukprot:365091-Chlamydomonas_euryale.AAC.17
MPLHRPFATRLMHERLQICGEVLELLDKHLVPSSSTTEASVFYLKMKADYYRYLAEFKTGDARNSTAESTLNAYQAAQVRASAYAHECGMVVVGKRQHGRYEWPSLLQAIANGKWII